MEWLVDFVNSVWRADGGYVVTAAVAALWVVYKHFRDRSLDREKTRKEHGFEAGIFALERRFESYGNFLNVVTDIDTSRLESDSGMALSEAIVDSKSRQDANHPDLARRTAQVLEDATRSLLKLKMSVATLFLVDSPEVEEHAKELSREINALEDVNKRVQIQVRRDGVSRLETHDQWIKGHLRCNEIAGRMAAQMREDLGIHELINRLVEDEE